MNVLRKETYEYAFSAVPANQRKAAGKICLILSGLTLSYSGIVIGVEFGRTMTFERAVGICAIGNLLLFLIGLFWGVQGCTTGRTGVSLIKRLLGAKTATFFSIFVVVVMTVWVGINGNFLAKLMISIIPNWRLPVPVTTLLLIVLGMLCSINGWRSLETVSKISVPVILLLMLYHMAQIGMQKGGFGFLLTYQPKAHMTFSVALAMIIGNFSTFTITSPDICRFAKNRRTVFGCVSVGILMLMASNLCGIIIAQATGANNLNYGIYLLGVMLPSFLWLMLCAYTTQNVNIYFGSLAMQNLVRGTFMEGNISYKTSALFIGGMSIIVGVTGISQYLRSITGIIALLIMPLTGIALAEVFGGKDKRAVKERNSLFAWIFGIMAGAAAWSCKMAAAWIFSFAAAVGLYALLRSRDKEENRRTKKEKNGD